MTGHAPAGAVLSVAASSLVVGEDAPELVETEKAPRSAMIMAGVTVGSGAVIGAGSVVKGTVAEYSIVAGAPARPVGHRQT